jgi:hypothetical protein
MYACTHTYIHTYIQGYTRLTHTHLPPPHQHQTHTHSLIATSAGVYLVAYQAEPPTKHEAVTTRGEGESDEFEDVLDDDLEALL